MDFDVALTFAKKIEKNAIPHVPYSGSFETSKLVDVAPKDIEDYTYTDLLNLYARIGKIKTTSEMFGPRSVPLTVTTRTGVGAKEVESRVRSITQDMLQRTQAAKEVPQQPSEQQPLPQIKKQESELDLSFEFEKERPKPPEILEKKSDQPKEEFDIFDLPEKKSEEIQVQEDTKPQIKFEIKSEKSQVEIPEILKTPQVPNNEKYTEIMDNFQSQFGSKANVVDIKKKMLDLTRELFKEKSVSRREEIKLQISILKNMLNDSAQQPSKKTMKVDYSARMFDALVSTQKAEVSNLKDSLVTAYTNKTDSLKTDFYNNVSSLADSDSEKRKLAYSKLMDSLTILVKSLSTDLKNKKDMVLSKHTGEWSNLKASPDFHQNKQLLREVDNLLSKMDSNYSLEFSAIKDILSRRVELLIESSSKDLSTVKEPPSVTNVTSIVSEINEIDEGTLLYYLHSHDSDYYKKYERNHVSKYEALLRAKVLFAKEKGLSAELINRYFGNMGDN